MKAMIHIANASVNEPSPDGPNHRPTSSPTRKFDADDSALLGYAGILLESEREELRSSRTGSLLLAYDLNRSKAEAR